MRKTSMKLNTDEVKTCFSRYDRDRIEHGVHCKIGAPRALINKKIIQSKHGVVG